MTDATHPDTIDWNGYWSTADDADRESASPSSQHVVDVLPEFFEERGIPETVADVGCGPGVVAFDVAERYPETTVVGYDAADPVLEENRNRADEHGLGNLGFERAVLPEFDPDREFETVFCYFTLCYVADVERALERMYDAVAPDGHLICNYQNRFAQARWQAMAENPHEYFDEDSAFDPDRFEDRFRLLIAGENLLSYEAIHEVLGTWPQSVWSEVAKPDKQWAWRDHPLVFVPK